MAKIRDFEKKVVYFNFQESEQVMVFMTHTKHLFVYSLSQNKFVVEGDLLPMINNQVEISSEFQDSVQQLFKSKMNSI